LLALNCSLAASQLLLWWGSFAEAVPGSAERQLRRWLGRWGLAQRQKLLPSAEVVGRFL